jgi:hypothetical protein
MTLNETDSFPRVGARDLFLVLQIFDRTRQTTLENIRLRICVDREIQRRGTFLWSAARDTSVELVRLGLVEGACNVKNTQQYETMRHNQLTLTPRGQELLDGFRTDRGAGYDALFAGLVAQHAYLRQFISILNHKDIVAPVVTSMESHVSPKFTSNVALAEAVTKRRFDPKDMMDRLEQRIGCKLEEVEKSAISNAVEGLVRDVLPSAFCDDLDRFAKGFLEKLNGIIIPAIFRKDGMSFDYRTHRALWAIGQEFKLWTVIRSHPAYDAWLIVRTATISLNEELNCLASTSFDFGLQETGNGFLGKLFLAYQDAQKIRSGTFIPAWELRAVFCTRFRCQPTVFNTLLDQSYDGSAEYALQLEIQRQKPQHEPPVRARNRNIGSIRVVRR